MGSLCLERKVKGYEEYFEDMEQRPLWQPRKATTS